MSLNVYFYQIKFFGSTFTTKLYLENRKTAGSENQLAQFKKKNKLALGENQMEKQLAQLECWITEGENRLAQLVDWNTWFLNISGVLQVEKEVSKKWKS